MSWRVWESLWRRIMRRVSGDNGTAAQTAQDILRLAELHRDQAKAATPVVERLAKQTVTPLAHDEYAARVARAFGPRPGRA